MTDHDCNVPHCDGTRLGHDLAVEFPEETRQVDEALDRLRNGDPDENYCTRCASYQCEHAHASY